MSRKIDEAFYVMKARENIVEAANYYSPIFGKVGGYADTDGEWCATRTSKEFKAYLESIGFEVIRCDATETSTAVAITSDGYRVAWNGYCSLVQ